MGFQPSIRKGGPRPRSQKSKVKVTNVKGQGLRSSSKVVGQVQEGQGQCQKGQGRRVKVKVVWEVLHPTQAFSFNDGEIYLCVTSPYKEPQC